MLRWIPAPYILLLKDFGGVLVMGIMSTGFCRRHHLERNDYQQHHGWESHREPFTFETQFTPTLFSKSMVVSDDQGCLIPAGVYTLIFSKPRLQTYRCTHVLKTKVMHTCRGKTCVPWSHVHSFVTTLLAKLPKSSKRKPQSCEPSAPKFGTLLETAKEHA